MGRNTPESRCRRLAEQHGWSSPVDEGDCISIDCPDGYSLDPDCTHGLVEPYGSPSENLSTKAQAYAYISSRITDGSCKPCDPDCDCKP